MGEVYELGNREMIGGLSAMKMKKFQMARWGTVAVLAGGMLWAGSAAAVTFSTPDGVSGTPNTQTTGGASRSGGSCSPAQVADGEAIGLLPSHETVFTARAHPTIYVYVPPMTARTATFTIQDENYETAIALEVDLPADGGIVAVSVPETAPELETGKTYKWLFEVGCFGQYDPNNPTVEGTVTRKDEVMAALPSEAIARARAYSEAGYWYEALAALAEARQSQPDDDRIATHWHELLASVGLEAVATENFAE